MLDRVCLHSPLRFAVAVIARQGAQTPCHRGWASTLHLGQLAGVGVDVEALSGQWFDSQVGQESEPVREVAAEGVPGSSGITEQEGLVSSSAWGCWLELSGKRRGEGESCELTTPT